MSNNTEVNSRFLFIKDFYPDLYELCVDAERYQDNDTAVCLLKSRQAMEYIVNYLGGDGDRLFDKICDLSNRQIIPPHITKAIHEIRMAANVSIHDAKAEQTQPMNKILNNLFEIVLWLSVVKDQRNLSAATFVSDSDKKIYLESSEQTLKNVPGDYDPFEQDEFYRSPKNILIKDVFETNEEFKHRIESLKPIHIGYAIIDKSQSYTSMNIVFATYQIDKNNKIIYSHEDALYAKSDEFNMDFADGELLAKLKVIEGRIYLDYDTIVLRNFNGTEIPLYSIKWGRYAYENPLEKIQRLSKYITLPIGVCIPNSNLYNINTQELPFKINTLRYVSEILPLTEFIITLDRDTAKTISQLRQELICYANIIYNSDDEIFYIREITIQDKDKFYSCSTKFSNEYINKLFGVHIKGDASVIQLQENIDQNVSNIDIDDKNCSIDSSPEDNDNENIKSKTVISNTNESESKKSCKNFVYKNLAVILCVIIGLFGFCSYQYLFKGINDKYYTIGDITVGKSTIMDFKQKYGDPTKDFPDGIDGYEIPVYYYGQGNYPPVEVYYSKGDKTIVGILVRQGGLSLPLNGSVKVGTKLTDVSKLGEYTLTETASEKKYTFKRGNCLAIIWVNNDNIVTAINVKLF